LRVRKPAATRFDLDEIETEKMVSAVKHRRH
jgi:hypothetical protein